MKKPLFGFGRKQPDAIVSFPKSGRTWLRVMLDQFDVDAVYTHAGAGHGQRREVSELSKDCEKEFDRIVFLYRGAADTAVSGFHQKQSRLGGYEGTISDFIRDPCHGVKKILDYNMMWHQLAKSRKRMKLISYEALRRNTVDELAEILTFLGKTADRDKILAVVDDSNFERMKKREAEGAYSKEYGKILMPADSGDENSFKVRKGLVGGYLVELSEEDSSWCRELVAKHDFSRVT